MIKKVVDTMPGDVAEDIQEKKSFKHEALGYGKSLLIALFLAAIFRTILFEPFHIPSGSMKSNLLVGDYLFVSKYSYGYSRYSMPFGPPVFEGRILAGDDMPKRGEVIVFKLPGDTGTNYIKRLIGLPGDKIQVKAGALYVNGSSVPKKYKDVFIDDDGSEIPRYTETLPNGIKYDVLDQMLNGMVDNTSVYIVPEGHYFFMGDNRDNSTDSRFMSDVGFVPYDHLVGRAEIIIWPEGFLKFWKLYKKINDNELTRNN